MKTRWLDRDLDWWIPGAMVLAILAVAVFAFVQSYTHGFYWAQTHHQTGTSLRMFPLIADCLMFAAGLTRLHLTKRGQKHWFPPGALALGATVTLAINVAAGIIWGWSTALTNSWAPVALFVIVELGMLLVRTAKAKLNETPQQPPLAERIAQEVQARQDLRTALTGLSQPQPAPDPSPETATFPKAVDSPPEPALEGWGQLAADQAALAGDQAALAGDQARLSGIGLKNGAHRRR